jgi:hypothetical protein
MILSFIYTFDINDRIITRRCTCSYSDQMQGLAFCCVPKTLKHKALFSLAAGGLFCTIPHYLNIRSCHVNNAWYLNTSRGILTGQQLFKLPKFTHDIMFAFLYVTCKSVLGSIYFHF